jgi:glutamyl-tRNA synthetase
MIKTRFAPSPTGYLHLGGARTALFAYLAARQGSGIFVLRIEDTDRERSTDESVQAILDGMAWLGLKEDEGPFYQTKRFDRYGDVIAELLEKDQAYRCYCSKERLTERRETQMQNKEKPRYDGCCRGLTAAEQDTSKPHVIRFKTPQTGEVRWTDLVHGDTVFANEELDDLIIARTDGTPTYNLTVVVDDADMKITHVIRGDDHINNTPRQIHIYNAMGANLPAFAHLPMILGPDGKRLSKRHGAMSVMDYREQGILPEALTNYLARLGWSHQDQEIFSMDELIKLFALSDVNRAAASFNPEKLAWTNAEYLKNSPFGMVKPELDYQYTLLSKSFDEKTQEKVFELLKEKHRNLKDLAQNSLYFFEDFETFEEKAVKKHFKSNSDTILEHLSSKFEALDSWNAVDIHTCIEQTAEHFDVGMGKVGMPLRVGITGGSQSPGIDVTAELLGKALTCKRIQKAIAAIKVKLANTP